MTGGLQKSRVMRTLDSAEERQNKRTIYAIHESDRIQDVVFQHLMYERSTYWTRTRIASISCRQTGNRQWCAADNCLDESHPVCVISLDKTNPHLQSAPEMVQTIGPKTGLDPRVCLSSVGVRLIRLRRISYLESGDGRSAAGEFQKLIDNPGMCWVYITGP
jgi:hypothetical protein